MPDITNLATTLTAVDYNTKINEIEKKIIDHDHDKCITTPEFNKLTSEKFAARLAWANLASKNDIIVLVKKRDFDEKLKDLNNKVTSNKAKHVLLEMNQINYQKNFKQYQQKN